MNVPGVARWLVIGLALVAATAAFVTMTRPDARTAASSVDAGFARDMALHHAQAVQMAAYTQDHAPSREVKALASTIAPQQQLEIGQMLGWLEAWELPRTTQEPAMSWMHGHGGHSMTEMARNTPMPGMASPAEMDALLNLDGKALEVRFLQLMIRHHQGGLPMAKAAARGASHAYVRDFAGQMVVSQAEEVDAMRQLLSARGGKALPSP